MEKHVKLINGVYDSTITTDTQIELVVGGEVFVKWISNATTAEKASAGYYVVSTLASGPFDYLTHKAVRQSDASGTLNGGVWQVGFDIVATTAQDRLEIKDAKKVSLTASADAAVNALAYPLSLQLHLIARTLELERKERKNGPLTPSEASEIAANETMWSNIRTIRDNETIKKAAVDAATTGAELDAIVF